MIYLSGLNKRFGKKAIFEDFSAEFPDKGIIAISGESGKGKTTLLRIIAGLDRKYSGKVDRGDIKKIAYVFQEPRLLPDSDALENVALPLGNTAEARKTAEAWLKRFGLENDIHVYPDEASGGMKQRISIARAFAYGSDLLLLDEPFNGLDADNASRVVDAIKEYAKEKLCVVVTHSDEYLKKLNCEIIEI